MTQKIDMNDLGAGGTNTDSLDRLIAKYGGRLPRYTSYPTAVQFSAAVGAADYHEWLAALGRADGAVSIYVHVPFCAQLCWYCGCHTKVVNSRAPVSDYVADLLAEIDLVSGVLSERLAIGSIHFGGGTPNMLSPDEFASILGRLAEKFDLGGEADIAVEIDPRLLSREWIAAAAGAGVRRASLGVQDFCTEVQAAINRRQPYEIVSRAIEALRAAGMGSINLDLMYGLPRQTVTSLEATIGEALTLAPDRLSLFGYAHMPWLKSHQKLIADADLPDARMRLVMQRHAAELFEVAGFRRLGLDHFARPQDRLAAAAAEQRMRRNFQGYTTDGANVLLGFGASAISCLPQGYVQNAADVVQWRAQIEAGALPVTRGIALAASDFFRAEIIERLMCDFRIDLAKVAARHGRTFADLEREYARLAEMEADGVVTLEESIVSVTPTGKDFVRSVCAVFDRYLDRDSLRHAQGI
ncbi:MAG TPA: oxygen-independent coproporphyrinogen III oxidase [Stellaceae bacterium]|nr:oxygen-independent coproporphyrinogen III oxidase [Stellaceae bacterium]